MQKICNKSSLKDAENELLEKLPCGVCKIALEEQLSIVYANSFFYKMHGYSPTQMIQAGFGNLNDFIFPDDYEEVHHRIRHSIKHEMTYFELEFRGICAKGGEFWISARVTICSEDFSDAVVVLFDVTKPKQELEELRAEEEKYRIGFQNTGSMMDIYDITTQSIIQPQQAARDFDLPTIIYDVPDSLVASDFVAEDSKEEFRQFFVSMQQGIPQGQCLVHLKYRDGTYHWYSAKFKTTYFKDGKPRRAVFSHDDVTEQREKELAYEKWSTYFKCHQEGSLAYYEYNLTTDTFREESSSAGHIKDRHEGGLADVVDNLLRYHIYEEDKPQFLEAFNREKMLLRFYEGPRQMSVEYRRFCDGKELWVSSNFQLVADPTTGEILAFILIENIDKRKREQLLFQEQVERDGLTGLYNRATMIHRVTSILKDSSVDACHAMLMIDIDYFKHLNDSFGHHFGDIVLVDVAEAIQTMCGPEDLAGRMGGDEFIVFFKNVNSLEEAEARLDNFCQKVSKTYDNGAAISISVGMARAPMDGAAFESLYQKADAALYRAKGRGRNCYVIYHSHIL